MAQRYFSVEIVEGGYIFDANSDINPEGTRKVLTSKAKLIKQIRETLDALEGTTPSDSEE